MWVKWKLVSVHLDIVLISAQYRCTVCNESTTGMEIALGTPLVLLGNVCQVEACFSLFGDSVVSTQDRCTVCTKCTIGLEIILACPMVVLGYVGQVEDRFGPFGDSVNIDAR
jgi:hypothetical protein